MFHRTWFSNNVLFLGDMIEVLIFGDVQQT